jgi:outer membrane receptor protein involved in Fe transport
LLEVDYSGFSATENYESKTGSTADPFFDKAPPGGGPWRYSDGLWYPYVWDIRRDQLDARLSSHADNFLKGDHEFKFGVGYGTGEGDTVTAGGPRGIYYYRNEYTYDYYRYEYTYEYYYRASSRAYHYGAETATFSAFVDDSWRITENLTLNLGIRYDSISSDIPDYPLLDMNWNETGETIPGVKNIVEWTHFSPRLGFAYSFRDVGVLRGFYGKFYDGNVTGNWYAPPPTPPVWTYEYSTSRNGPWTPYYIWEWHTNTVDPNLKPPEADQFTLGYEHRLGSSYTLGVQAIYKETVNLIGWEILGDGVYEMVPWRNPFTGEVEELASVIEQPTTRKGNRPGDGSLAPPGEHYNQDFKGFVLSFNKRYSGGWSMFGSYTYSDSTGFLPQPWSENQGDPFYTQTTGRDPNIWRNATQALQNERRHVIQVQSNMDMPWKLNGSVMYRFLDGKPYNRQVEVGGQGSRTPLEQGAVTVIAIPAQSDVTRPSQNVFDLSLSRPFDLGPVDLTVRLDLLNATNEDSWEYWQTLNVPPGDHYRPNYYLWPRRLMVNLALDF